MLAKLYNFEVWTTKFSSGNTSHKQLEAIKENDAFGVKDLRKSNRQRPCEENDDFGVSESKQEESWARGPSFKSREASRPSARREKLQGLQLGERSFKAFS